MIKIRKILVANRGEIAVRIIRACKSEKIRTIAVYSSLDGMDSLHARMADEALELPGHDLKDTYLNIDNIIAAARKSGAQAIHPGYGFLSENSRFARACEKAGIIFIGPSSKAIALMGNKIEAKRQVGELGIPVLDSYTGTAEELATFREELEYPVLVKPAAGGGGKGMRIIKKPDSFLETIETAGREAGNYFGDPQLYIEKYLPHARHIEIQVLADHFKKVLHLNERECSIQRRYQKIIEESPSPGMDDKLRSRMTQAAVQIAQKIDYVSAGTVEFMVDTDRQFYFLEMNTRIQVEHPVTEMVTGIDIVGEQIKIASGQPLDLEQKDISINGHSIEARIYAEDPTKGFAPVPGTITFYREPEIQGIRIDASLDGRADIRPEYDPMICKVIVHADDRIHAIEKLDEALGRFHIHGITSNLAFLKAVLSDSNYIKDNVSTSYCQHEMDNLLERMEQVRSGISMDILIPAALITRIRGHEPDIEISSTVWRRLGYWRHVRRPSISVDGKPVISAVCSISDEKIEYRLAGRLMWIGYRLEGNRLLLFDGDKEHECYISVSKDGKQYISINGMQFVTELADYLPDDEPVIMNQGSGEHNDDLIVSPLHGKIVRILVEEKDKVEKGDTLFVVDSMKIENNVVAPRDGSIDSIIARTGDQIKLNMPVMILN